MSGGSFEYACQVYDLEYAMIKQEQWARLSDAFEAEGFDDVAAEFDALRVQLDLAERRIMARVERLRPAAKAMEWWKSGDWGRDEVETAVDALRAQASTPEEPTGRETVSESKTYTVRREVTTNSFGDNPDVVTYQMVAVSTEVDQMGKPVLQVVVCVNEQGRTGEATSRAQGRAAVRLLAVLDAQDDTWVQE